MWKVVYIAQNKDVLARAKAALEANSFLVQVREVAAGNRGCSYEICVPVSESQEAYEVICSIFTSK
jgi:hypothetical protein